MGFQCMERVHVIDLTHGVQGCPRRIALLGYALVVN